MCQQINMVSDQMLPQNPSIGDVLHQFQNVTQLHTFAQLFIYMCDCLHTLTILTIIKPDLFGFSLLI